jgi:hypothetical protein
VKSFCYTQLNPLTQMRGRSIPIAESNCCFGSRRRFWKRVESFYSLTCVNSRASAKFRNVLNRHVGQTECRSGSNGTGSDFSTVYRNPCTLQDSYYLRRGIFFGQTDPQIHNPSNQHITFPRCSHDYCVSRENISARDPNGVLHCGALGGHHRSDSIDLSCHSWRSPLFPLCGDRSPGGRVRWFRRGHVLTARVDQWMARS